MAAANTLRRGDLRNIYRLLGECRDRGDDPRAWRAQLFEGVRRLTGSLVALGGEGRLLPEMYLVPEPTRGVIDLGWPDEAARLRFLEYLNQQDYRKDDEISLVVNRRVLPLLATGRRQVVTRRRCDLVSDDQWYASYAFTHYRQNCGIDDEILSWATIDDTVVHIPVVRGSPDPVMRGTTVVRGSPDPAPTETFGPSFGEIGRPAPNTMLNVIAVHRALGAPPFSLRDARLVHWLHCELRELIGATLSRGPRVRDDRPSLTPRLRQVLEYLLVGSSEKQIADRLGISPATVHEHIKRLHRMLDVSSRGELLVQAQRVLEHPLVPQYDGVVAQPDPTG